MKCPYCAGDLPTKTDRCHHCNRKLPASTMWVEMPLCYTHVCTACGAEMDVYDRSYWMDLECTSCGTRFLAKPPEEATD